MPSQASPRQAASGAGATDPLLLWKTGFNILVVVSGSRALDKPWVAVRSRKCVNYVGQLVWRGQPRWHRTNLLMTSAQERGGSTGKQGQDPPYKRVFNPFLHTDKWIMEEPQFPCIMAVVRLVRKSQLRQLNSCFGSFKK